MKLLKRRWVGLAGLVMVGAPALFLIGEHVQSRWHLGGWKSAQLAQGEKFTIPECLPPPPAQPRVENRFRALMALCAARTRNPLGSFAPPTLLLVEPGRALSLRTLERWSPNLTRAELAANPGASNMTWALLGRELADRSGMFSEAKTLLHEPRVEAELDYYMGFNLLLPHLGPLKSLGQDLNTCALYEMRRGNLPGAIDQIKDALTVARLLENERILISQLIRQAIATIAIGGTWQAMQYEGWTDAQLADLQQTWESTEFLTPMSHAIEMERAVVIELFDKMRGSVDAAAQNFSGLGGGSGGTRPPMTSLGDLFSYIGDHAGELLTRGLVIPTWQFAWSREDEYVYLTWTQTRLDVLRAADRTGYDASSRATIRNRSLPSAEGINNLRHRFSIQLVGGLEHVIDRTVNAEGLKELAVTALALQRYQLRHGHPASSLEQLVPEFLPALPRDYWSGQTLRYRLVPGQPPLLYGVGTDGHDDGGDPTPRQGTLKSAGLVGGRDVVWPAAAPAAPDGSVPTPGAGK
jgi:hypothetical protein